MDWLAARQEKIEDALAARHLAGGTLVLYDVSSAAFEGRTCPLGAIGHPKDGVRGRLQIVYGLLTSKDGVPVAIEVFEGNTGDPKTVASQVGKVKDRFGITRVVLVGDRGMLTAARLREDVGPAGLDWITALRAPQVKALVRDGALQLSLFDEADLAEITHPDYPGERLVACKNPFLEAERARKREASSPPPKPTWPRSPPLSRGNAGRCAARTRSRCAPTGCCAAARSPSTSPSSITDDHFSYARDQDSITAEAALDGIYVLRTSVDRRRPGQRRGGLLLQGPRPGRAGVPRLQHRPGHPAHPPPHRDPGPRARVLADAVVLHHLAHARPPRAAAVHRRRQSQPPRPPAPAPSPRPPAPRAPWPKPPPSAPPATCPCTASPACCADLATICLNQIQPADPALPGFRLVTTPTPLQRQALDLLGVSHRLGIA